MKQEQQQQAQRLYFQTDLSKSEIASMLGISRSTLHHWVRDYNWDHIKQSAAAIPTQLAENCYFIMAKMQEEILSESRNGKPATFLEVNSLYKLTLTIGKLQKRCPLNETLEMGAHFMEFVDQRSPEAADFIKPYIDSYILARAAEPKQSTPVKKATAPTTPTEQDDTEARLDLEDLSYWAENPSEVPIAKVAENKATAQQSSNNDLQISPYPDQPNPKLQTSSSSLNPKNHPHLNRAQRRYLARTKAAA